MVGCEKPAVVGQCTHVSRWPLQWSSLVFSRGQEYPADGGHSSREPKRYQETERVFVRVEEDVEIEKRKSDIRSQLKGLRVNRVFTTDFGDLSDKELDCKLDNGRTRRNTVTTKMLPHGNDFAEND